LACGEILVSMDIAWLHFSRKNTDAFSFWGVHGWSRRSHWSCSLSVCGNFQPQLILTLKILCQSDSWQFHRSTPHGSELHSWKQEWGSRLFLKEHIWTKMGFKIVPILPKRTDMENQLFHIHRQSRVILTVMSTCFGVCLIPISTDYRY
jgi:hypothetical protein